MAEQKNTGILIHFEGFVQGVGFRYAAERIAQNFAVAGYVKNLPDGRVEIKVEGDPGEIEMYLDALSKRMARYIKKTVRKESPPEGRYDSFIIEF
jgi:acylphosphatase